MLVITTVMACFILCFRINNNVLDHVAMQNETTANEGGKAKARENRLAPHHMDTTSRVCQYIVLYDNAAIESSSV